AQIAPGGTSARIALTSSSLAAGDYQLQIRTKGARAAAPGSDVLRISVPAAPQAASALFFRRGPATANRDVATADLRFRRSERLRVAVGCRGSSPEEQRACRLRRRRDADTQHVAARRGGASTL